MEIWVVNLAVAVVVKLRGVADAPHSGVPSQEIVIVRTMKHVRNGTYYWSGGNNGNVGGQPCCSSCGQIEGMRRIGLESAQST